MNLYPGINFEHTLDGVLFDVEYTQFLYKEYYINIPYLLDYVKELIQLRDVVIPSNLIRLSEVTELISKRTNVDFKAKKFGIINQSGIYEWQYRFIRDFPRTIDEMMEDDIRLAMDIVKKYPKHKDLVKREKNYES